MKNDRRDDMNESSFYGRVFIIITSLFLTGVAGSLILGYYLRKIGKSTVVVPLTLIVLIVNFCLIQLVIILKEKAVSHWELNKRIGWGSGFTSLFISHLYSTLEYFIPNVILGVILAIPIWNRYSGKRQTNF